MESSASRGVLHNRLGAAAVFPLLAALFFAPKSAAAQTQPPADDWNERDRALNEPSAINGGAGLLHMQHAQANAPGQFTLSFTTEYFSAGFLCTAAYPCPNPNGSGGAVTSDTLNHIGGSLALNVSILNWLEAYAGTSAIANSDTANRPSLLQVLGDSNLGVKAHVKLNNWLHVGLAPELWLVNGTGAVGLDGSGTSAKIRALGTADLRGTEKHIPLRVSLNGTYSIDNSGDTIASTEAARGTSITRIERYGLEINRVDHFDINLGAEYFFAEDRVRPFVEYGILIPVNRQGYLCRPDNPSGDRCLKNDALAPSKLTIGGRFYPWKHGFSVLAALDIGVTGVGNFIEEVAPQAPWTLYIGGGWSIDTVDRPPVEKLVEKVVQVKPPARGHIKGFVHEKDQTAGVANAIVDFDNHEELAMIATEADGHFTTPELAPGPYVLSFRADGFKPGQTCNVEVPKGGKDIEADCPLEALPRVGTVVGNVRDADSNAAIPIASVILKDSANKDVTLSVDSSGHYRAEGITPGSAMVTVEAEGYLTLVQPADVKARQENTADLLVHKRPKNALVNVGKTEITIKQQIQFAVDSATILPESYTLLNEIADVMMRNPRLRKMEIQGHTDNSGSPEHNKILSEDRANAVRTWLTQHGVDGGRLEARGFGQSKPLVPNVTSGNKAKNRRVQFIILEQDAPQPTGRKP